MIIDAHGWQHEPTPWAALAACKGSEPDLWFPERGQSLNSAKAVCGHCPVRHDCLDYALRWGITFGVWGGLSEGERRELGRRPRPRKVPSPHGTTTRYARGCRCDECRTANGQAALSRRSP